MNTNEILETIDMIDNENLDVRTITMGISLLDCAGPDPEAAAQKVYDKICRYGENLVKTGEDISRQYGIPIINKRISVTPIAMVAGACPGASPLRFAKALDRAAHTVGVNFIGGYSALVQKGFGPGDYALIESIPQALSETELVCSSVNVGSTKAGINMDAVGKMGRIVRETAELTADRECIGAAKLVVFCNAPEDNPFMAGAFHGPGEPDCVTRMGQLVAQEASRRLSVPFGIVDLSLAPTPAIGDSVAYILEGMGLEECGAHGTTAALALLNDAVKKGGVMASSSVGGLSGAFIPVTEDAGMIAAARSGCLTLNKLEAMTCVCSVGLDMIVIPGDTSAEIISGIIADEAAIGMVNSKTTAVRVIPAIGKQAGEELDFGGLLGQGPVMPVNTASPAEFVRRGGKIPAPLQSLKN